MRPAGPRLTQLSYVALHNSSKEYIASQHLAPRFAELPALALYMVVRLGPLEHRLQKWGRSADSCNRRFDPF